MTGDGRLFPPDTIHAPVLTHATAGQGPPVLLLNGGLMSMAAWEPIAVPLADDFTVVRCDLRGQLLSPGDVPSLEGQADEIVRLLDELGLPTVHVVGTSFGALVGMVLAAAHPRRVRALVVVTATERLTPEMNEATTVARAACRRAAEGGSGTAVFDLFTEATFSETWRTTHADELALRRELIGRLPRGWFHGLDALLGSIEGLDLRPRLAAIAAPTLVLAGEADRTFPLERSQALATGIPRATLRVVPGGSHALVLEHAETVVAVVREFLQS